MRDDLVVELKHIQANTFDGIQKRQDKLEKYLDEVHANSIKDQEKN